jgi:hypothetical protein
MSYFVAVGLALIALLGLVLLSSGLKRLIRRRLVSGTTRGLAGLALLASVLLAVLAGLNLYTYSRFTHETPVAEIEIRALAPQRYRVTFFPAESGPPQVFDIYGDEWQVDARILKWRGLGVWLGFETVYRLERLSGRYRDLAQERAEPRTVYLLSPDPGVDVWDLARRFSGWLPLVDAVYGSSTYLPLADGARFRVSVSTTGLLARPANEPAAAAIGRWH